MFAGLSVRGSGAGPPQVQSSLTGGITDLLLDEQSFVAMHNRMLQLCLPTAVDAVSPDAVVLLLHALGVRAALPPSLPRPAPLPLLPSRAADVRFLPTCSQAYLKAAVNSCPEGSTPSGGGRSLDGSLAPPPQWRFAADNARPEPEFEPLETESELHDRAAPPPLAVLLLHGV